MRFDIVRPGAWRHHRAAVATVMGLRVLAVGMLVVACSADPAPYIAILDELAVPQGWEAERTVAQAPGGELECSPTPFTRCPSVIRYYLADATQVEAYQDALAAVTGSGYTVEQEFNATCERQDVPCGFTSVRDDDRINVNVYQSGENDGTGFDVARPDLVSIRVTVQGK